VRDPKLLAQQVPRKTFLFVIGVFRRGVKVLSLFWDVTQR